MKKIFKTDKGFTLVEVLISLTVFLILSTGLYSALRANVSAHTKTLKKYEAIQIAYQYAIETVYFDILPITGKVSYNDVEYDISDISSKSLVPGIQQHNLSVEGNGSSTLFYYFTVD